MGEEAEAGAALGPVDSGRVHRYIRRRWGKGLRQKGKKKIGLKQLRAQALRHNRTGGARTHDHLMMTNVDKQQLPASLSRRGFGKGGWRKYPPEAVCKIAFSSAYCAFESNKAEGGSKSHALQSTWAMAAIISDAQQEAVSKLGRPLAGSAASSHGVADDFQINNNMFDETQLWLKRSGADKVGRKRRRSILASATQVTTRKRPGDVIEDVDILRPPKRLRHYTAAGCAGILGLPDLSLIHI